MDPARPEAELGSSPLQLLRAQTHKEGKRSLSRSPDLVVSLAWTPLSLQQPTQQSCVSPMSSPDFCPSQYLASNSLISLTCLFIPPFYACSSPNQSKYSLSPLIPPRDILQGAPCLHHLMGCVSPLACGVEALLGALGPVGSWDGFSV